MLSRNIKAIAESESLRWIGCLLCVCNIVTFLFVMPQAVFNLSNHVNPQCWQYFPSCFEFRITSPSFWWVYFFGYLALSIGGMIWFYKNKVPRGYQVLLIITFMKVFFLVMDRSFLGNYHFMHLCFSFVYLFFSAKEESLKVLLAWFYLAAGTLKLNEEWLSGASIGRGLPFLSTNLQLLSYAYVVVLELFVVWGLFSKNNFVRWFCFIQFLIFHLVSYHWVDFFYPAIMISLLMIFPFTWLNKQKEKVQTWKAMAPIAVLLCLLSGAQLRAVLGDKDAAIFAHRRLFSMNMFDARSVCAMSFHIHRDSGEIIYNPDLRDEGLRVRCDPSLILNLARNICADQKKDPAFKSLDIYMNSKRTTDASFKSIFAAQDACARIEKMSFSDWMTERL